MSHDRVINYIDTHLRDLVPNDTREELIALHYEAVNRAKVAGIKEGEKRSLPPRPKPKIPPNETIQETVPTTLLISIAAAVVFAVVFVVGVCIGGATC